MATVASGRMDRQIVLQRSGTVQDAQTGQDVLEWTSSASIAAEWLPSTATEVWQGKQGIHAEVDGAYCIYDQQPRPTPDAARIVGHDGRLYDIKGVIEIGRGVGLMVFVIAKGEAP
jgi:hypothetical protein